MSMNSKKQRRFRVWDNRLLYETLKKVTQITYTVDAKCGDSITPKDLPVSLVPTDILYDICVCFDTLYQKLLTEELIMLGHPSQTKTMH